MKGGLITWFVVALTGILSAAAVAQGGRAHRTVPRATIEAPRFDYPRLPTTTLRAPDDGIIHWNTPNKDGNLGGPGTGGSGGGGG
jgi:hypothetical protein